MDERREFLITSGNPIKEDPDYLATLIEKLDKHGASAFGIKTERFIGMIPQEAIAAADRLNFPLIYIPMDFAFYRYYQSGIRRGNQ